MQQTTVQGIGNVVSSVDTCSVQNNQRKDLHELLIRQICTSLAGLTSKLDQNIKDAHRINYNHTMMETRMEQKDKKLKVEFGNGIDSVARQRESRLEEGMGDQAMVSQGSKVAVGSEVNPRDPVVGIWGRQ